MCTPARVWLRLQGVMVGRAGKDWMSGLLAGPALVLRYCWAGGATLHQLSTANTDLAGLALQSRHTAGHTEAAFSRGKAVCKVPQSPLAVSSQRYNAGQAEIPAAGWAGPPLQLCPPPQGAAAPRHLQPSHVGGVKPRQGQGNIHNHQWR